jgi:hypothetical protein
MKLGVEWRVLGVESRNWSPRLDRITRVPRPPVTVQVGQVGQGKILEAAVQSGRNELVDNTRKTSANSGATLLVIDGFIRGSHQHRSRRFFR